MELAIYNKNEAVECQLKVNEIEQKLKVESENQQLKI